MNQLRESDMSALSESRFEDLPERLQSGDAVGGKKIPALLQQCKDCVLGEGVVVGPGQQV